MRPSVDGWQQQLHSGHSGANEAGLDWVKSVPPIFMPGLQDWIVSQMPLGRAQSEPNSEPISPKKKPLELKSKWLFKWYLMWGKS